MKVNRLEIHQFRNIEHAEILPSDGINILFGENAQGKTNILEALWLFTGGRSFRGAKDKDLTRFGQESAVLLEEVFSEDREQEIKIVIDKKRKAFVNEIEQPAMSRLIGKFPAVIFFPDHLFLVKEGPEGRRRFMDAALCQIQPTYIQSLVRYQRILSQRNVVLKNWKVSPNEPLLDVLTAELVKFGQQIVEKRIDYTNCLKEKAVLRYSGLSGEREQLELQYEPHRQYEENNFAQQIEILTKLFEEKKPVDIEAGFTTSGPHREDLSILLDGKSARHYGSQGQQRSVVLALKLAEAEILKEKTGECPLVLLDDVMSELDASRQEYMVNQLDGWQVFISCCEPEAVLPKVNGKRFEVKSGTVTER
ncbi:MAG: DNA replication/repair protein RecF [Clostridia bacterium]|nr:DNA replication/repair protein RecF [Clostridia bacterium]